MNEQQAGRTNGCLEAGQLLAWHDGALSPRKAAEVMAHLEGCARCAAEERALLRDRRQVFELLSRLDPLPDTLAAPEAALARFHQRLAVRNTGTVLNHSHEDPLLEDLPLAGSERVEVLSISVRHAPRKSRARAFVQVLTAVLVIGTLVGTMLLLLTPYHTKRMIVGAETRGAEKGCTFYSKTAYVNNYDLSGVTALSRNDIWVVGGFYVPARDPHALLEHWNGSQWCIRSDPYSINGTETVGLRAIAADSPTDAWAVGNVEGGLTGSAGQILIEHWNGTRWSVVPSPKIGFGGGLWGVAAISPTDAWAVGDYALDIGADEKTLIEHWNGKKWSIVPNPFSSVSISFHAITALSDNDVWIAGTQIAHWNGQRWSIVPSPGQLYSIAAVSANDVWAVGGFSNSTQGQIVDESLTLHWNGSRWSVVSSPSPNTLGNDLTSVTVRSANDVWAVGTPYNMLIEHWDGSRWSVIRRNSTYGPTLATVALVPHSNTIVAVGVGSLLYFKDPDGESLSKP